MSEFDDIQGFEGWKNKLDELIKASEDATDASTKKRLAIKARLAEFRRASYPNNTKIKRLDAIAKKTGKAITKDLLDKRLTSLKSRRKELEALTTEFEREAKANVKAAKKIKLENITSVVDSLTKTTKALQKLRDSVKAGDDATLVEDIDSARTAVDQLLGKFKAKKNENKKSKKSSKKKN